MTDPRKGESKSSESDEVKGVALNLKHSFENVHYIGRVADSVDLDASHGRRALPDLTLKELQLRCKQELDVQIGITALWQQLDKLGLSFKKNASRQRARS